MLLFFSVLVSCVNHTGNWTTPSFPADLFVLGFLLLLECDSVSLFCSFFFNLLQNLTCFFVFLLFFVLFWGYFFKLKMNQRQVLLQANFLINEEELSIVLSRSLIG